MFRCNISISFHHLPPSHRFTLHAMTRCLTWRQYCVIPPPVRTADRLQEACNSIQTNRDNRFLMDMCGVTRKRQAIFFFLFFYRHVSPSVKGVLKNRAAQRHRSWRHQRGVHFGEELLGKCKMGCVTQVGYSWIMGEKKCCSVCLWLGLGLWVGKCSLQEKKKALILIRLNRLWNIRAFSIMSKISLCCRDIYWSKDSNKLVWATLSYHKHFKI